MTAHSIKTEQKMTVQQQNNLVHIVAIIIFALVLAFLK